MKKVVKLTESDLTNIIKRVINEGVVAGMSVDDFVKSHTQSQNSGETPQTSGTWKIENGKLYITNKEGISTVNLR